VTDLLFAKLAADPALMLVDREDIKKLLDEHELSLSAWSTRTSHQGRPDHRAKLLITGSCSRSTTPSIWSRKSRTETAAS